MGEGAGVGGEAGAEGSMLRGTPFLFDVDSLFRVCGMLCLDLAVLKLSAGMGCGAGNW